ncbi:MAG: hypothetical protein WA941_01800 [Nitrososphaeraceae archaeon]
MLVPRNNKDSQDDNNGNGSDSSSSSSSSSAADAAAAAAASSSNDDGESVEHQPWEIRKLVTKPCFRTLTFQRSKADQASQYYAQRRFLKHPFI